MKCPICSKEVEKLTRDHIIPRWIYTSSNKLIPNFKKNLGQKNIQMICSACNHKKGGSIDVSTETGMMFWLDVREQINKKISEFHR